MRTTLHADPYSGHEVLVVETPGGPLGVAYDPRRATCPVPWSASCPHCRAGRLRGPSPGTSRLLRMLVSRRTIARPSDLTKKQARVVGPPSERGTSTTCRPPRATPPSSSTGAEAGPSTPS